ncbi:hypothetical protein B0T17DRAFT_657794 [Bombardia bombarda]|uniref:Uncharacterized protein n=1 Tax=Bombardia bombarda TaxID=252184 RepID=A0AA39U6S2_9PEZI|nr:hypothetical protein B0T17DRAFT_657794 [Bombardia bombarda]
MDSRFSNQNFDDAYSHNPRSRNSSGTSTTEGLFQSLHLAESPTNPPSFETASYTSSRPPSSRGLTSSSYNTSPHIHHLPSFSPPHSSQNQRPFTRPTQAVSDADWFETDRPQAQGTPLLRVEPSPEHNSTLASSPPLASIESEAMSTVALQYDSGYNMGSRASFGWPVLEPGSGLLGPDLSHYTSDPSLTPPSGSRSVTASPPRGTLTAEQRELKRQRDQARHSSKMYSRGHRTGSSSSSVYSPTTSLADPGTGASNMPIYTTAPAQISLLAEPPTTQYLPSFSSPIHDHNQGGIYTNPYPASSYMTNYNYSSTAAPSLPPHYGRQMADPSLGMYAVPSVMGHGSPDAAGQVRVVQSRPKPQCWDHGCNGRQFSTFSNLLRHQREKSGQAAKATCPNCGAEFTRTTARNGHLLHDKCKQKRAGST